jgi:ribosome biogenesis protein ENP2
MAMKVATFNGCKVYNLSSGKTMPNWLPEPKRRALAKDEDYARRLELIQDFENTVASQCIKMTNDGEHIIVTGIYPPVVKCYTVSDLALKFQRGLTCDVVSFETLSDDFGKLVFLQSDRTLNFHAPYGTHYSVRIPKFGRCLSYNWESCDLFVGAGGDEIYRLNLEAGQFREPFKLSSSGCNKMHINPTHRLLGCGLDGGICEFWDMRSRTCANKLTVDMDATVSVTALKFDVDDGLTLGVGTSNGNCILYDIRSSRPLYTKEHQYGLPVIDIAYHMQTSGAATAERHIISTDKKIVKIWERDGPNMGKIMTNIETPADINDILVVGDKRGQSGMLMIAGEQQRIMNYFVPQLGPAPRWCSFLESITEELEETTQQSVYEDFKFLTRSEVEELGASALIGTPMLKGTLMYIVMVDLVFTMCAQDTCMGSSLR